LQRFGFRVEKEFTMETRTFKQITERDRVVISKLKVAGLSISEIARRLGKHKSSVSRELRRNANISDEDDKRFWLRVRHLWSDEELDRQLEKLSCKERESFVAEKRTWTAGIAQSNRNCRLAQASQRRRRKKPQTRRWILEKLKQSWSPEQIAGRSRIEGPEQVSHEYVYQMLIRDRKQGGRYYRLLKRFKRRKQRLGNRQYPSSSIPNRVGIENRPAIVEERSRLGDHEGDLIIGYRASGYVLSVIDRKSKFTVLRKLKTKRKLPVKEGLVHAMRKMRSAHTLTLDNGREFSAHQDLSRETGVNIYFANPYSSIERATVENHNGLVRYFLPKKTCFKHLSQSRLNEIQNLLNKRPRKILGYLTPEEVHLNKYPSSQKALHL
jgi:IS30 family transposase